MQPPGFAAKDPWICGRDTRRANDTMTTARVWRGFPRPRRWDGSPGGQKPHRRSPGRIDLSARAVRRGAVRAAAVVSSALRPRGLLAGLSHLAARGQRRGARVPRRCPRAARCESPARSPRGRSAEETTAAARTAPRRTARAERSIRPGLRRCGFWPPGDPSHLRGLGNPRQTRAVVIVSFALRVSRPQIHGSLAANPGGCMTGAGDRMSRRQWLAAGAALAGYALAAAPSLAQAVRTDEAGLATARAEITGGGVALPGYDAPPADPAKAPIVVLVSEIWGIHEYIRDCARRFAKAGYCAVAPELFAPAGGVAQITDTQTLLMIVNRQRREALLGDLRATMDWARGRPGVNAERVGVNGWCWGGALTIQAAARLPGLRAAVAWYATPTRPFQGDGGPVTGFEMAKDVRIPFLSLSGALDRSPSPEDMKRFVDLVRVGNPNVEMVVYPNAGHAFHADYRASYQPAAAAAAWEKCLQFFARHLRA